MLELLTIIDTYLKIICISSIVGFILVLVLVLLIVWLYYRKSKKDDECHDCSFYITDDKKSYCISCVGCIKEEMN